MTEHFDPDSVASYEYALPPELIAQAPAQQRDRSRLMVIGRSAGTIGHHQFAELPQLLRPGDLLVVNETRVVPARLFGYRTSTGGKWEGLFLREDVPGRWRLIGHTRGRLRPGEELTIVPAQTKATGNRSGRHEESSRARTEAALPSGQAAGDTLQLKLLLKHESGEWTAQPQSDRPVLELLERFGTVPLPHYMQREAEEGDRERYQTTYARTPGAVAAPTAGLHFTPDVFSRCRDRGIDVATVTLHVGLGTFRPISTSRLSEHVMHREWCELPARTVEQMEAARTRGGRIVAVGTTTVRTLESAAASGSLRAWSGETDLFIRPPYRFRAVDVLLTNFHLPRSTLLVLVATFAGRELVLRAYEEAVKQRYRFYSYGDAMLIE